MTSRLPVELWQEIFSYVVVSRILPRQGANLFEDMDIFGHPCKINHYLVSDRASLRLVCRLWDEIIRCDGNRTYCVFTEAVSQDVFDLDTVRRAHRLEFIESCETYCLKWPCKLTSERSGRCPPKIIDKGDQPGRISVRGDWPMKIQVVRFIRDFRDPTRLLQYSKNLKALSIQFSNLKKLDKVTVLPIIQYHLSHLRLDKIYDDGTIHALDLPHIRHLELHFALISRYQDYYVFPLDIYMPNVVTIFLHGTVGNHYNSSVERLIMSSKETLVNLLLSHDEWCNTRLFPLDKLTQFPQLSTLGLSILRLHRPFPDAFCTQPLLYMSPLTLLLLDIETHCQNPEWALRQAYVNTCLDMFARPGKWFSGVVIPLGWSELEDLWVQACELHDAAFAFIDGAIDDPLPCYWTVISQISQAGISIRDRNGVGLWEGEGFKLTQRMEAFAESDRFAGYGFGKKL